jgi:mannose/fructose/N-acetylgalactosamine-specific phosphotransferase system component IIB
MNRKLIFRVDDRLIHGQVIEGWIKYFKIREIIIVSDRVCKDDLQRMIYSSILPEDCILQFYSIENFINNFAEIYSAKRSILILFESVRDLYNVREVLNDEIIINVGCVASREHKIEITDTVFLDKDELILLSKLREKYDIQVKKLPWETAVEIKNFLSLIGE